MNAPRITHPVLRGIEFTSDNTKVKNLPLFYSIFFLLFWCSGSCITFPKRNHISDVVRWAWEAVFMLIPFSNFLLKDLAVLTKPLLCLVHF
jgi:hypothetical protein